VTRVLLVSNEPVGATMAGPGIRYRQFALQLADRFDVTLVIPNRPEEELPGVRVLWAREYGYGRFRHLARSHDVVVAQQLSIATMQSLARSGTPTVYDLYDPLLFEALAFSAGQAGGDSSGAPLSRAALLKQVVALQTASAFLCASERQRDLWLGLLSALGRVDFHEYGRDPSLRQLIRVVPFGIEPEPPRAQEPVLKGVVPGIEEGDRVLLWGGGIWNWFDPLTPIRAVAELTKRRRGVHLFFLGVRHPSPRVADMDMAERAQALAGELGILGSAVHFNFGWTPYEQRAGFLLEADVGISAHFESVESRFALRTRLLDYFWADLPTVTTRGDMLGDLVGERGLGRSVAPEAVDEWVAAIEGLLSNEAEYAAVQRRIAETREEFTWPRVVEPLAQLLSEPLPESRFPPRVASTMARYLWSGLTGTIRDRGVVRTAEGIAGVLRRPDVP
jgi:glycosyltransferase involved in cell wall biosynthesis